MVVTRGGVTGPGVVGHVVEEVSNAFVYATIPDMQTEEKTAADWDEIKNRGNVTHLDAQVKFL